MIRHPGRGLALLLASSAAFSTSGPFAKPLIAVGWSPGLVVLLRMTIAALVLLPAALWAVRRRWGVVRRELGPTVLYGVMAVGMAQLGFFNAVARIPVTVALLVEYSGTVLVVAWVWLTTRRPPARLTIAGVLVALTGLALVLDVSGATTPDPLGLAWAGLAAVGMAGYFVLAARHTDLPPITFAAFGLATGAVLLAVLGVTGLIGMHAGAPTVELAGVAAPAWLPLVEVALVAAALAYVIGSIGTRHLGSTVASFVGLTEVLFALVFAWVFVGEFPLPLQLVGGVVLLGGIALVRAGDRAEAVRSRGSMRDDREVERTPSAVTERDATSHRF